MTVLAALRMPCEAERPKRGIRPVGVRDVYRGDKSQLGYLTYGGAGPWPWRDILALAQDGKLVRTYPEHADSFTLPGNEWRPQ